VRAQCGIGDNEEMVRGKDVMDVWLDSGSAWFAVANRDGQDPEIPVDLVVEGVDQFRGWFQCLLLTAVGTMVSISPLYNILYYIPCQDQVPYKQVMVHGFAVDQEAKKMSKSVGNVIDPDLVC
jgi:isoleucyl-tRNA synthetase